MTKRFERIYEDVDVFCRDHNAKGLSQLIEREDYDKIVDLLNELHEENRSLKFQLDECRNHKLFSRRELEKENEQLKHDAAVLIQSNYDYRRENEILKEWKDNATVEYMKLKNTCNECKKENEQFKKQVDKIDFILEDLNGAEYITRDDAIEALNKIDKVIE